MEGLQCLSHQCGGSYDPVGQQFLECPKVPDATRQPTECYNLLSPDSFNCLNRMDKPDIFNKPVYQEQPFILNRDLEVNGSSIYCKEGQFIPLTWGGLIDLWNNIPYCEAKNNTGRRIAGRTLWFLLLRDLGFTSREKIPEDYIIFQ